MLIEVLQKKQTKSLDYSAKLDHVEGMTLLENIVSVDDEQKKELIIRSNKAFNQIKEVNFKINLKDSHINSENTLVLDTDSKIDQIEVVLENESILLNNAELNNLEDILLKKEEEIKELINNSSDLLSIEDLNEIEIKNVEDLDEVIIGINEKTIKFKEDDISVKNRAIDKIKKPENILLILTLDSIDEDLFNQVLKSSEEILKELNSENLIAILNNKKINLESKDFIIKNILFDSIKEENKIEYLYLNEDEAIDSISSDTDNILIGLMKNSCALLDLETLKISKNAFKDVFYKNAVVDSKDFVNLLRRGVETLDLNKICENNQISLVVQEEVLLALNSDMLSEENKEGIVDSYHKTLISEGLPVTGRISLENFSSLLANPETKHNIVVDSLLNAEFYVKDLELKYAIARVVQTGLVHAKKIIYLLGREDLFSKEYNQVIVDNELVVVDDFKIFKKIVNYSDIEPETLEVLERRYELLYGKEGSSIEETKKYQLELVNKFKKYMNGDLEIPVLQETTDLIVELNHMYSFANKIDPSIEKGVAFGNKILNEGNFDSDSYEVLDKNQLNSIAVKVLKKNPSEEYINYIYEQESIPMEFKIGDILKASECSYKILDMYQEEKDLIHFIIMNPAIDGNRIISIAETVASIFPDLNSEMYKRILDHPNAPIEVIKKIFEGVGKLANDIRDERDPDVLEKMFFDVYAYPEEKRFHFNIDLDQQNSLLKLFIENKNASGELLQDYVDIYGEDDEDVLEKIPSHPNCGEDLLSELILYNFDNSIIGKKYLENNDRSFEEVVSLCKNVLDNLDLAIDSNIPASLMTIIEAQSRIINELENEDIDEEDVSLFNELKEIAQVYKNELYKKKFNEYKSVFLNSQDAYNVKRLVVNVEEDHAFYNGLFTFKEEDKENLLTIVVNNPYVTISDKSRLLEKYDLR